MKRRWIVLIIAGAFILTTLVIALAIHISFYRDICPDDICHTPQCVKVSSQILRSIDGNVNPCDNFYRFACGRFLDEAEVPVSTGSVSTAGITNDNIVTQLKLVLEEPIQQNDIKAFELTKEYYKVCLDTDSVEQQGLSLLYEVLEKVGGWPVLQDSSWNSKSFDWFYYIYKLRQLGVPSDCFFKISVAHDYKNTTFHILEIDQPTLTIPQNYLINQEEYKNVLEEYQRYMINVAVYLGAEEYRAVNELGEVLKFEMDLAEIMEPQGDRSNVTNFYNIMMVKDLETEISTIPWLEYFNNMIAPYAEITYFERILIPSPSYIKNLEALLESTSKRTQINYIVWKAIESLVPYLNEDLRDLQLKFKSVLYGISEYKPRWEECIDEVYNSFPLILSIQYVKMFPIDDVEERISELIHNIKMEYIATIEAAEWIDKKVKQSTVVKLTNMKSIIGFSPDLLNDKKFADAFNKAHVFQNKYMQSFLNISLAKENYKYKHLRELKSRTVWMDENIGVKEKTFYSALTNTITIGLGIIQENYFNDLHPNYLNYGGIGFEIAREISRVFFDVAQQFDEHGDFVKSKRDNEYTNKKTCLIEQYNRYEIEELDNKTFSGESTLENNMADNYGIKLAYDSYVTWAQKNDQEKVLPGLNYNQVQLFWISFALNACSKTRPESFDVMVEIDSYAPSEFRVVGPLVNVEDFAKDFDCDSDASMNSQERCNIW
ncbi:hypothetical protein RN001_003920 [Aquatica leii]|uniref:Neprilysin n=1 Tax=Aquatica leii TaxID=1421715 RepID=A0AAN7PJ08_9COLE|nr:hypothetical protein RN001_003920 [Aquatica leii]